MTDTEHLNRLFSKLQGCCLHNPVWVPADVTRVLCSIWSHGYDWVDGEKTYEDTDSKSITIVQLRDGKYGLLEEGEDYTGHGCQCDSATAVYDTQADLLHNGVSDDSARKAVCQRLEMPGTCG